MYSVAQETIETADPDKVREADTLRFAISIYRMLRDQGPQSKSTSEAILEVMQDVVPVIEAKTMPETLVVVRSSWLTDPKKI